MKKSSVALLILVLLTFDSFGQENASGEIKHTIIKTESV
jgi:hypothetical protein